MTASSVPDRPGVPNPVLSRPTFPAAPAAEHATAVVIAARDAARTVGTAVASALAQPETAELLVVDDASGDATTEAACDAAGGDGRLRVLRNPVNLGPAGSRNLAVEAARSPFVAVLDADDAFLPGRLAMLYAHRGWDVIADDVAFVPVIGNACALFPAHHLSPARGPTEAMALNLARFVDGNRTRRGRARSELGFLKPVFRRAFLVERGLRYREDLRLGEDFELLARVLAAGARMRVVRRCGYAALVRPDSLSASHRTGELERYAAATAHLAATLPHLTAAETAALRRQAGRIRRRWRHRLFLDRRREAGALAALRSVPIHALAPIAAAIARDKIAARDAPAPTGTLLRPDAGRAGTG